MNDWVLEQTVRNEIQPKLPMAVCKSMGDAERDQVTRQGLAVRFSPLLQVSLFRLFSWLHQLFRFVVFMNQGNGQKYFTSLSNLPKWRLM
jgi:hypothetical protein